MIFLREWKMPMTIKAFVLPDADGNYNIYVNQDLSDEAKDEAIEHEMFHIRNGDCYRQDETLEEIEKRAHKHDGEKQWRKK